LALATLVAKTPVRAKGVGASARTALPSQFERENSSQQMALFLFGIGLGRLELSSITSRKLPVDAR
jgi:hypothetical protein